MTLCVAIAIPSVRHDAIGAERSNRWTFGSGTLIRFHPRGVKMSEFRDSSAGTRSEASVSAFSRRKEEQSRGRQADRRKAAYGDEPRGLRRGSTPKKTTSCQGTSRSGFSLNRLRKRYMVLGDALSNCSSQVSPARPPNGGVRERILSRGRRIFIVRLFTYPRFVKEQRRKIFGLHSTNFSRP